MADGEVTLLIRSPSLKQEEREVRTRRDCTVRELKAQLRRELSGEPMEQDQRLIYSGKLLPDQLKLNEVLSKESRHVLHLVCSTRSAPRSQVQEKKQPIGNIPVTSQPVSPSAEGIRQRILPQNIPTAQTGNARNLNVNQPGANPVFSPYAMYSPQQILWLQQMYARQYYMQYFAAATSPSSQAQRVPDIPVVAGAAAPDQMAPPFPANNQPANLDVQPPANPAANPNIQLDARGRLLEEDDDINRDWLHWLYTIARFSIFLSILYFYSSVSRFMMVLVAMILMYLHHAGLFPFRRRPQAQEVVNPAPQAVPNHQDQNNNLQGEDEQPNDANNATAAAALQTQSFANTAWVFFKTFFASLIPEGPPAVA
ncbi:homocysteine-responsive endoplasmic reticulum-resident ubiquitin-like domain member 1 protein [Discoglossus pictus]